MYRLDQWPLWPAYPAGSNNSLSTDVYCFCDKMPLRQLVIGVIITRELVRTLNIGDTLLEDLVENLGV